MKTKSRTSILYCIGQGFVNIKRNKLFFLASTATIAACIFLVGLFVTIAMNLSYMVNQISSNVCITVFFDEGLSDGQIREIGAQIAAWDQVSHMEYTSAEQAWEQFKVEYFADYPELAEGFAEDNPLANSASYDIYLNDIADQGQVSIMLQNTEGIRQVNQSESTAGALTDIGKIVGVVSAILIVVLLCVSAFLINNTITTGITLRSEELQIMKFVGATNFFIKFPFVFEGVFIGLIGAAIPLAVIFFIYRSAMEFFVEQFQTMSSLLTFMEISDVYKVLIPLALVIGVGIGLLGSWHATGKHINV